MPEKRWTKVRTSNRGANAARLADARGEWSGQHEKSQDVEGEGKSALIPSGPPRGRSEKLGSVRVVDRRPKDRPQGNQRELRRKKTNSIAPPGREPAWAKGRKGGEVATTKKGRKNIKGGRRLSNQVGKKKKGEKNLDAVGAVPQVKLSGEKRAGRRRVVCQPSRTERRVVGGDLPSGKKGKEPAETPSCVSTGKSTEKNRIPQRSL